MQPGRRHRRGVGVGLDGADASLRVIEETLQVRQALRLRVAQVQVGGADRADEDEPLAGARDGDIQTAFLYDHFTPFVLVQLEELGFCERGEAKDFATIANLSLGGRLPINTSGGLLGEAYIHGMNGITEAVRQIRGTSCNQVPSVEHVLVTAGTGCPTSGLILGPG